MKNFLTILICFPLFMSAQKYDKGKFYISIGNSYVPHSFNEYDLLLKNSQFIGFGNEWITGITVDGDDDNDLGVDYYNNDEQSDKRRNFNLSGKFGYFLSKGLLFGIGLDFGSINYNSFQEADGDGDGIDDEYTNESSYATFELSPFLRYNIPFNNNAWFFNTSYSFGSVSGKQVEEYDYTSLTDYVWEYELEDNRITRLIFGTGISFFLTESISFEPSLNYAINKYSQNEEVYLGNSSTGNPIYDDQERVTSTNAFYINVSGSIYF